MTFLNIQDEKRWKSHRGCRNLRCNLDFTTQYCQTTSPLALPQCARSWLCDKWTACPPYPTLPYPFYAPIIVATASAQKST